MSLHDIYAMLILSHMPPRKSHPDRWIGNGWAGTRNVGTKHCGWGNSVLGLDVCMCSCIRWYVRGFWDFWMRNVGVDGFLHDYLER